MPKNKNTKKGPLWGQENYNQTAPGFSVHSIRGSVASGPFGFRKDPQKNGYLVTLYVAAGEHEIWAVIVDKRVAATVTALLNAAHNRTSEKVLEAVAKIGQSVLILTDAVGGCEYSEPMPDNIVVEGM